MYFRARNSSVKLMELPVPTFRIYCHKTLTKSDRERQKEQDPEVVMDSSWNWFIDNGLVRTALVVTGFAVWLGLTVGLLAL